MSTVLIIDDEPGIQLMLELFFQSKDWSVCKALTGREAEELIGKETYDAVILDYHLPGKNGEELLSVMQERNVDRPVIMTTGSSKQEIEAALAYPQVKDVAEKPFDLEEIFSKINKIITT